MSNLSNWIDAARIYSEVKGENIYSCFCKSFADHRFTDVKDLRILDAGCGDGEYTEMFRQKGAVATGCDGSPKVIEIAKARHPLCAFDTVDLSAKMPYRDGQFDLVFSNLVLMDIDPIDTTIKEISRVVKTGGMLYFSIVHPAFYLAEWEKNDSGKKISKNVTSYLTHQSHEQLWGTQPVLHYHRPISFYLNLLAENGFILSRMHEPSVYEDAKIPDIPLFLFVEFNKG